MPEAEKGSHAYRVVGATVTDPDGQVIGTSRSGLEARAWCRARRYVVVDGLVRAAGYTSNDPPKQLVADEARGWIEVAARHLLTLSVRRLPAAERERWREEWLAELHALWNRPIALMIWTAHLAVFGSRRMAKELAATPPLAKSEGEAPGASTM